MLSKVPCVHMASDTEHYLISLYPQCYTNRYNCNCFNPPDEGKE